MPDINAEIKHAHQIGDLSPKQDSPVTLEIQDDSMEAGYVIYVYNILELEHIVRQPPLLPRFVVPSCPKGERVVWTTLPAFMRERREKTGTTEVFTRRVDGRRVATSALNPSAYPGTDWKAQIQNWNSSDQFGNNLNVFGVWWSLTKPDDPKLDAEIKQFRSIVTKTMEGLIKHAEALNASNRRDEITPNMHFAMDYLGKAANWHMPMRHMILCPNCGDQVPEGISYHRNSFGDRCIIDPERYALSVERQTQPQEQNEAPARKGTRKEKQVHA